VLGDTDVNIPPGRLELDPGFQQIESRPDRRGARGLAGGFVIPTPQARTGSGRREWALLATCLQVGACSRLGEMLVIDFDRRPEAVEFARARIELPGDSIQFLLGQT
jgi:hypothetical protein